MVKNRDLVIELAAKTQNIIGGKRDKSYQHT
jgi:hypothetical protein